MATSYSTERGSKLEPNMRCPRDRQINILLLGPTGVGKTTFINALANYMMSDTLDEAVEDEMQVVIPASFSFSDPETFDEIPIRLGQESKYELFGEKGESNTQQCRSFVFPIGQRILRLIDTPGIGDTRGLEQDTKNFQEILNYIAQYEHLNGICILLKPTEERLTVLFRFCINELLRHLHVDAKENLIFLFTNSRPTFFTPGNTRRLVEVILKKHRDDYNVFIPFSRTNTFLFDNESFRYLAIRKQNIQLNEDQTESYMKSWDHSVKEYTRLMEYLVTRPLHAVRDTLSLNEAEQLIRKLPRPIAETAKLIEENIQLANDFKKKVEENPELAFEGIPQNDVQIIELAHPRTVCVGERCCRVIEDGSEMKIEYLSICHDECYLKGVEQETLYDQKLEECTAMNPEDGRCSKRRSFFFVRISNCLGFCLVCDCHWLQHKHITYEYRTNRTHTKSTTERKQRLSSRDIDRRVDDLRKEAAQIQYVYRKLAEFLHTNSILPINDDVIEYLQYFIREEQMKQGAGAQNQDVIIGLQNMVNEFTSNIELLKRTLNEQKQAGSERDVIQPEKIFDLVGTLYALPITGRQIQQQVEGIKLGQERYGSQREILVKLPSKAASSRVMIQVRRITSDRMID